jgi:glycosyltransferase involved in cell wall biosynthesis
MKVAVLMPVYNSARFVAQALQSLLRQRDAAQLAIIVADDGSTDGTPDIVRRLAVEAPEISLHQVPHGGISRARNATLAATPQDADFVTFLDADDISPAGRLRRDLARMAPATDLFYGSAQTFQHLAPGTLRVEEGDRKVQFRGTQLGGALCRAAFIRRIGDFDVALKTCEDVDFLLRAFELRPNYFLSDEVCVFYRQHDGNTTRDRAQIRKDFMLMLSKSLQRRRTLGAFEYPPGVFNGMDLTRLREVER